METELVRDPPPAVGDRICASQSFLAAWSDDYGWFTDGAHVLPFFIVERSGYRQMVFTIETIFVHDPTPLDAERSFLERVARLAMDTDADFIAQPRTTSVFRTAPRGSISVPWGSYRVDLAQSEEALFASFHRHHRRLVCKADRAGLTVASGRDCLEECYALIRGLLEREEKPCLPKRLFERFATALGNGVGFHLALENGRPVASALFLIDKGSSYFLVGGREPDAHHGATAFLHWQAMRAARARGVGTYDFVGGRVHPVAGSRQEGLQVFKSRFGGSFQEGVLWKLALRTDRFTAFRQRTRAEDAANGTHFNEDMIDNELRTTHLPRSDRI